MDPFETSFKRAVEPQGNLKGRLPGVAIVAIIVATYNVSPAPIWIDDYLSVHIRATSWRGATLPGKAWMRLCVVRANLLGYNRS